MPTGTTTYTLTRGEEQFDLELEFTYDPIIPAQTYGPPEDCSPAEGGEITHIKAWFDGRKFELLPEEYEGIERWLYDNYAFDDDDYDPEES
jgi:hypothetical protein